MSQGTICQLCQGANSESVRLESVIHGHRVYKRVSSPCISVNSRKRRLKSSSCLTHWYSVHAPATRTHAQFIMRFKNCNLGKNSQFAIFRHSHLVTHVLPWKASLTCALSSEYIVHRFVAFQNCKHLWKKCCPSPWDSTCKIEICAMCE